MALIWIGALLLLAGVMLMVAQPLWSGRLSGGRIGRTQGKTLEPPRPGRGLGIRSNWPGLALAAIGGALILASAFPF